MLVLAVPEEPHVRARDAALTVEALMSTKDRKKTVIVLFSESEQVKNC